MVGISSYQQGHSGHWPHTLTDISPYLPQQFLEDHDNPREGFSGYHYAAPDVPIDQIENPVDRAILFEVRDDGTVAYDSGVIGYAGGSVAFIEGLQGSLLD